MKRTQCLLLSMFCAVVLTSCEWMYFPSRRLGYISSIMNEKPDSAFALLQSVDTAQMNEYNKHFYTYLYTRACDKLKRPITWTDRMQAAAEYLEGKSDKFLTFDAFYYAGVAQQAAENYVTAVEDLFHSLNYLPEGALYDEAFVYRELYKCYAAEKMYDEAIAMAHHAARLFAYIGRRDHEAYSYISIGAYLGLMPNSNEDSTRLYLEKAYSLYSELNDSFGMADALNMQAQFYGLTGKLDLALGMCRRAIELQSDMEASYRTIGAIFLFRHERDSALYYLTPERLNAIDVIDRINYYQQLYKMERALGNTAMQVRWADSLMSCRKRIEEQDESASIRNLVHQRQLGLIEQRYQRKLTLTYLWVIAALVVVLIAIIVRYALTWKERRILQRKENLRTQMFLLLMQTEQDKEDALAEEDIVDTGIEKTRNDSAVTPGVRSGMPSEVAPHFLAGEVVPAAAVSAVSLMVQLRREQLRQCRELFERSVSARVLQHLRMSAMPKLNESQRQELQQDIQLCFGDVCHGLLLEYAPRLKPNDALMCLALYLGCDHRQCAVLMGTTENGVRSRKKRVKQVLVPEDFALLCGGQR